MSTSNLSDLGTPKLCFLCAKDIPLPFYVRPFGTIKHARCFICEGERSNDPSGSGQLICETHPDYTQKVYDFKASRKDPTSG